MATHGYTSTTHLRKCPRSSSVWPEVLPLSGREGAQCQAPPTDKSFKLTIQTYDITKRFIVDGFLVWLYLIDGDGYEPKWCALFGARNAICLVFKIHSEWYRYLKEPHLKQCSIAKMECHAMICGSNASWSAALSNKAPMVQLFVCWTNDETCFQKISPKNTELKTWKKLSMLSNF